MKNLKNVIISVFVLGICSLCFFAKADRIKNDELAQKEMRESILNLGQLRVKYGYLPEKSKMTSVMKQDIVKECDRRIESVNKLKEQARREHRISMLAGDWLKRCGIKSGAVCEKFFGSKTLDEFSSNIDALIAIHKAIKAEYSDAAYPARKPPAPTSHKPKPGARGRRGEFNSGHRQ